MNQRIKPHNRGGASLENLRGKLREYEKNIRQLRKYVRYLENQLGIGAKYHDMVVEVSTKKKEVEDFCDHCKSTDVNYVFIKKVNEPVKIKKCADCGYTVVVKDG